MLQKIVPQSAVLHPLCTQLGLCIPQLERHVLDQKNYGKTSSHIVTAAATIFFKAFQVGSFKRDLKVVPKKSYCRAENRNCVLSSCTKLLALLEGPERGYTARQQQGGTDSMARKVSLQKQVPGFQVPSISILGNKSAVSGWASAKVLKKHMPALTPNPTQKSRLSTRVAPAYYACPRGEARGGAK